jgi:uncharacterized protein (DUF2062 family)
MLRRLRALFLAARHENASPRQIGIAVGIGTACCLAPVFWLHLWLALAFATLFRVNRLWAALSAQAPSLVGLLRPIIVFGQVQLGRKIRTGAWLTIDLDHVVADAPALLADWALGAAVLCALLAPLAGVVAYGVSTRARACSTAER